MTAPLPESPSPRDIAIAAAEAGGAILRSHFGTELQVRYKGEIDLVTQVDEAAEAAVVELIRRRFPTHTILAEEGSTGGEDREHRWIIDPLDGTTNYSHGMPPFCISIAYERAGDLNVGVIYDPTIGEMFVAERGKGATLNGKPIHVSNTSVLRRALLATGFPYDAELLPLALSQFVWFARRAQAVRRIGSAALDLAYVAAGRFDGYWEGFIHSWDIAAGVLLVEEAGGTVTALNGRPLDLQNPDLTALASNGTLHETMRETLADVRVLDLGE
jgi:myo-inositol-1(or 4)-monophosphatase